MKQIIIPTLTAVFVVSVFAFFALHITPGMTSDNSDWVMYVSHARNIATHHAYGETGYVYQPESTTEVGATAYPSGLPLLLVPVYEFEGLNLGLFKTLNAIFLALSLWPAYLYARRTLSPLSSLCIVVLLGFSTLFLFAFNAIGSDSPYELFSLFTLVFLLWLYDRQLDRSKPWLAGLCAGAAITVAYLIRPVGIALLVGLVATELWRKRKITGFAVAPVLALIPLVALNNYFFHADGGYMRQFTFSPKEIAHHAAEYAGFFSYAFSSPVGKAYRYALWFLSIVPLIVSLFKRAKSGLGVADFYFFTLLAVNAVFWQTNPRYLLPLMPLYLVYLFEGFQSLASRVPQAVQMPLKCAAALVLLITPAANAWIVRPPKDTLITSPAFESLCASVRKETPANALILFWNPRVLAFCTAHHASGWPDEGDRAAMDHYFQRVKPGFVVIDKERPDDNQYLLPATAADPVVFENEKFRMVAVPAH